MIINVNEGYRISSDESQWIVQRKSVNKKNGNINWKNLTYHSEFGRAVDSLLQRQIRMINGDDVYLISKKIDEISNELREACNRFDSLDTV